MTQMKELAGLMRQLEDQLVSCMKCGICQSVCPLYDQTGKESDVARGKLALLEGLMQSMFKDPEGVYERLNKCLLCGSCAANCPTGVDVLEIFMKARAILTGYMGLSPLKRLALRGMLANPRLFDRLAEWGAVFQKLFTRPVNEVIGSSCTRLVSPLLSDRHFTALAKNPFHRRFPSLDRPAGGSGLKVLLFTGCLIDKLYPDIGQATLEVLDYLGVGVFLPGNQACCGIPAISGGDLKTFKSLVSHNLERFNHGSFDYLVTSCATCTSTIREVWPKMAGPGLLDQTRDLADKTMDINQFLVEKNLLSTLPDPGGDAVIVTYHDPCHLKKSLKVFAEPRQVIAADPACKLVEMPESDWCCGMGGSFNLKYYGISRNIGLRKAENIISTGASVVTSGCPACMAQISDILSQLGARIAVKHPIQLYAEGISKHEAAFKTG